MERMASKGTDCTSEPSTPLERAKDTQRTFPNRISAA